MDINGNLPWIDILVIALYFCVIICLGVVVIIKQSRSDVQNYFLAGRTMPWYAVGGSLFSSNVGTEMVIALSGAGAAAGISLVMYEWIPIFIILMFAWFLLPVYISAQVYTLPEYMEKRFGGNRLRIYLSCIGIVIIIITKMASVMFSGALFIQVVVKWDMYVAVVALLIVSMIFTMLGGLKAVMVIGALQTVMVLLGGVVIMIISFIRIGGYQNLQEQYAGAIPSQRNNNTTCGLPRADAFHIFQDARDGDQPWPGLLLQASVGGIFHWCCNQTLVQRSLAARSLSHAKGGAVLLSIIKIFPLFLIVFPGMISRIFYPDEVACADPEVCKMVCDNTAGCSNIAYPMLIMGLLPIGLRGLLIAVMVSGIMITLSSVTNSTSTVFTMDVWRKLRPSAKQRELLIVGRVSVIVMCAVAVMWIPFVKAFQNGRLFSYMLSMSGYLGSPLGALFCLSVLWTRATEKGAFTGIILAHLLGLVRLILELMYPAPSCEDIGDKRIFISKLHYTYFIQIQMLFMIVVVGTVSMITKQRTEDQLRGVTWWTKVSPHERDQVKDMQLDVLQSKMKKQGSSSDEQSFSSLLKPNEHVGETESPTLCQRFSIFLCGANEDVQTSNFELMKTKDFLKENKTVARVLNALAVTLMVFVGFLIGFFK